MVLLQRVILFICVIVFVIIAFPVTSYADEEIEKVRVGYYENEIFQEGAEEGEVKNGYAYEYYRKLSEYTGWEYEYVYGEFGDLYQMLLDGEIDLLAGLAWREDRASIIGYPNAVMGNESYYLVKHDADADVTADPVTLNGCRIGVLDSAMVGVLNQYLDDNHVTAKVVTFSDYKDLFNAFDSREVDILAAESDGAHGREKSCYQSHSPRLSRLYPHNAAARTAVPCILRDNKSVGLGLVRRSVICHRVLDVGRCRNERPCARLACGYTEAPV